MKNRKSAVMRALLTLMAALTVALTGCVDDEAAVGSITGLVRDSSTNSALSGVTVFTDPLTKAAVTDAAGRYTISDIDVRSYEVVATKDGYFEGLTTATLVENATITVNFALEPDDTPAPGSITGVVTRADNGSAIAGASVSTVPATSAVTTNAAGQYTITDVTAGSYQVNVTATGYTLASSNAAVTAGLATLVNFALTSNTQGSIVGVVRNSVTTLPLAGVSISTTPATATTVTDANGQYNLNSVAPGSYRVNASLAGYIAGYVDVAVTAGQQTAGDITLAPAPGSISGTIRNNTTDSPIGGVTVTTNPSTTSVVTDAGGQYHIANIPAGNYSVTANANGHESATTNAIIFPGQDTSVDLSLTPSFMEIEDNNSMASANTVSPLMLIKGHIGPVASDPYDWFSISMPAGVNNGLLVLAVQNTSTGSAVVGSAYVIDVAGETLGSQANITAGSIETLSPIPTTSGVEYFIRVASRTSGTGQEANYRITPTFTAGQHTDPYSNDSQATAVSVAVPGEVSAMIGYGAFGSVDTEDWWRLEGPASGNLSVVATNLHPANVGDSRGKIPRVRILSSLGLPGGALSTRIDIIPANAETLGPISVTPGATYYILVDRSSSTIAAAPYRLNINP